jgi:serine/threonine protein kinase
VAIKVIDKTRFQDFQNEISIFQNEITILYNVKHPGIVKLHALFDEVEHVKFKKSIFFFKFSKCFFQLYIITERLATDMLEMILNGKPPRLSERVSKFVTYQVNTLNWLAQENTYKFCFFFYEDNDCFRFAS